MVFNSAPPLPSLLNLKQPETNIERRFFYTDFLNRNIFQKLALVLPNLLMNEVLKKEAYKEFITTIIPLIKARLKSKPKNNLNVYRRPVDHKTKKLKSIIDGF